MPSAGHHLPAGRLRSSDGAAQSPGAGNLVLYDSSNRRIATIDPLGNYNTVVYDALSQVAAQVDPLGNATSYTYANGQPTAVQDPWGTSPPRSSTR